ncbi:transposase [Novipirellula maiorica]
MLWFESRTYQRRCIIEQTIGWLKECRRVATRNEKLARNFLAMVKRSMIGRYLRIIPPWNSAV